MVRLIMHGCNGKMGQVITRMVKEDPEVEIVAGVDKYTGISNDYPVYDEIGKCSVEADALIDFSNAAAVDELLAYCREEETSGSAVYHRTFRRTAEKSGRGC